MSSNKFEPVLIPLVTELVSHGALQCELIPADSPLEQWPSYPLLYRSHSSRALRAKYKKSIRCEFAKLSCLPLLHHAWMNMHLGQC